MAWSPNGNRIGPSPIKLSGTTCTAILDQKISYTPRLKARSNRKYRFFKYSDWLYCRKWFYALSAPCNRPRAQPPFYRNVNVGGFPLKNTGRKFPALPEFSGGQQNFSTKITFQAALVAKPASKSIEPPLSRSSSFTILKSELTGRTRMRSVDNFSEFDTGVTCPSEQQTIILTTVFTQNVPLILYAVLLCGSCTEANRYSCPTILEQVCGKSSYRSRSMNQPSPK